MARAKKPSRRKGGVSVDFTGVESGGRTCPDGTYQFEVVEAKLTKSSEDNDMFKLKLKGKTGKAKGVVVYDNLSLLAQALWKCKGFLESMGQEVPEGAVELEPEDWIGETVTAAIINETYEGKERPKVAEYKVTEDEEESKEEESEEEEEEEEEEKPKRKSRSSKKKADEDEEEEEDEEESDEEEEESDDEEEEESDEDEEEEDEEEEKPKKGSKGKKSSGSKFKVGAKVKFKDEKGKLVKGVITMVDDETALIEDASENEWEVDVSELQAA